MYFGGFPLTFFLFICLLLLLFLFSPPSSISWTSFLSRPKSKECNCYAQKEFHEKTSISSLYTMLLSFLPPYKVILWWDHCVTTCVYLRQFPIRNSLKKQRPVWACASTGASTGFRGWFWTGWLSAWRQASHHGRSRMWHRELLTSW